MDPELYNKCEAEYEHQCLTKRHESEERQHRWELIYQQASKQKKQYANHVTSNDSMPVEESRPVNIPERIPEEPEGDHMAVDNSG